MKQFKSLFYILLYTSPFINLTLITGLGMPLAYIVTLIAMVILTLTARSFPRNLLGFSDLIFMGCIFAIFITLFINNAGNIFTPGIKQIINFLLTYLIYKTTQLLLIKGKINPSTLLNKIYSYYTYVILCSLLLYLIGYMNEPLMRSIITIFNNSGNFDLGGIAINRMTGFSAEPSFWSFFIAINIALGLITEKPKKWMMVLNILCLLLTVGRTGYLIGAGILILKFWKDGIWQRVLVVMAGIAGIIYAIPMLNIAFLMSVDDSFYQRIESLVIATSLVAKNPLLGIGMGNFPLYAKAEGLYYTDIFNLYLYIMVGSGIFGLFFFVAFLLTYTRDILIKYRIIVYATMVGWLTVSSYNLPYVWLLFGSIMYLSKNNISFQKKLCNKESAA